MLRTLSTLLILSAEELSKQIIDVDSPIAPYIILFLLFGHAGAELTSPHTAAGWSNEKLLEWLDGHTSDKERFKIY